MEKAYRVAKIIKNNWKKSAVGVVTFYYSANFAKEKYQINVLMRAACKEAVKYGDATIVMGRNPTLVTVILNPVANKRKAKQDYEKYCEPLLHLAGLQVEVVQTTTEGNAKEIVENLKGTEVIIVAGGDGTLSEAVTGLLRRNDDANRFPLGVLPLGQTNSVANMLFPCKGKKEKVKQLIDASMAIIKGKIEWKHAMKIEPMPKENEPPTRPIYALSSIQWGAFRDVKARKDKYWYFGPLRHHASFIFNGYKDSLTWICKGSIKYTPPCAGCENCIVKKPQSKSKWFFLIPSMEAAPQPNKVLNPGCTKSKELCFKTCELNVKSPNINISSDIPSLKIMLGKNSLKYKDFVVEGWKRIKTDSCDYSKYIQARTVDILPEDIQDNNMFEIDNEEYEMRPMKITLLPNVVKLFCSS